MIEKIIAIGLVSVITFSNSVYAYSGKNAANYAKTFAKNYSTVYPKFSSDCTNFVSQCVRAGGLPLQWADSDSINYGSLGKVYNTKDKWFCAKYTRELKVLGIVVDKKEDFVWSSTWSLVSENEDNKYGFYQYMKNRGASVREYSVSTVKELNTFISNCEVGDVLQKRKDKHHNKSHSVIVTDKSYDKKNKRYDMKIAYHTTDTAPTDFRTVSWKKFGEDCLWTIIKPSKIK